MDALKFPHLLRWMDHIQNKANFGDMFEKIPVEKPSFVPHVTKTIVKVEEDNPKKNVQSTKTAQKSEPEATVKKSETAKKPKADAEPNQEKKKPEDVLNPKKKQLEKITPNLYTDEKGVATFKGIPFMTSAGPCTSSIPKASIK
ncbi:hypothetical protein CRG98_033435 [Punica granatum]|uniref:Uncharacterized protein n=1 Tax=Punica granatum TaxID=22663 RepID=A0A2I0IQ98_PUNGR|nr:hypothetical protein CRG98_033435 [Punica granatum]